MKTLLIVALVVALPATASAHTTDELDEWQEGWWATFTKTGMTMELAGEWTEVMSRHLEYAGKVPEPEPRDARETAGATSRYVNRGMGTSVEQWRGLVAAHFPASQVDRALCIVSHESGGHPGAKNPRSSARGLFQILASLWAPEYGIAYDDLYDAELNTRIAADLWSKYGWWPWSPYKRGECR